MASPRIQHCANYIGTLSFPFVCRGFVDIDCNSLFHVIDCESVHTRGLNLRLYKEHCNVNCRLNAFVCGNINVWNRLPAHVVNSDSVAVFKRRLACVDRVNLCSCGTYWCCFQGNLCVLRVFIFIIIIIYSLNKAGYPALTTSVCISGYPLSGYPDLSVNFMAAKNPDILK